MVLQLLRHHIRKVFVVSTLVLAPFQASFADDTASKQSDVEQTFSHPLLLAEGAQLTSPYGVRTDPVTEKVSWHAGVDIGGVPFETELFAPAAGEVVVADYKQGYGRTVDIKLTESGHIIRYAHLHSIRVAVGDSVKPGEVVALLGSSGRNAGPHVHIEYRIQEKQFNPEKIDGLRFVAEE